MSATTSDVRKKLEEVGLLPIKGGPVDSPIPLKPCPFCGSTDLQTYVYSDDAYVQCKDCGTCGPGAKKSLPVAAAAIWNKRS